MEILIVVVVVAAVFAFLNRDKIKALITKTSTTNSTPAPAASAAVSPPPADPHEAVPDAQKIVEAIDFLRPRVSPEPVTLYDLQVKLGYGLSDPQIRFAQARGVFVKPDQAPVQSVRDLSTNMADLAVHGPWFLQDGQQMTLTGSGRVRIFGAAGTQLRSVNGVDVSGTTGWHDASLPFTFSVVSTGGNIAAQRVA